MHEKILFLTFLITVTNSLTEVAGGGMDLLWIMASVLACAVEIYTSWRIRYRELMLEIRLRYNPLPILRDSPLPAMPLVS